MLRSAYIFLCLTMAFALQPIYPMESESADGAWSLVKNHPIFTAGAFATGFASCVGLLLGCDIYRAVRQKRQSEQEEKYHTILMATSKEEEIREALKYVSIDYLHGRLTMEARRRTITEVALCLKCGAQPTAYGWEKLNKTSSLQYSVAALDAALDRDQVDMLALFFEHGVTVKTQVICKPLLLAALEKKAVKSATYLLTECQADPNEGTEDGMRPLHVAVMYRLTTNLVTLLLEKGSELNAIARPTWSSREHTALDFVRFDLNTWQEGKKLLKERGAKTAKQLGAKENK